MVSVLMTLGVETFGDDTFGDEMCGLGVEILGVEILGETLTLVYACASFAPAIGSVVSVQMTISDFAILFFFNLLISYFVILRWCSGAKPPEQPLFFLQLIRISFASQDSLPLHLIGTEKSLAVRSSACRLGS